MTAGRLVAALAGLALLLAAAYGGFLWFVCRVHVEADETLVLIRKTGDPLPAGQIIASEPAQKGIQREALGPGRYFFNPLVWSWRKEPLLKIPAGNPSTWTIEFEGDGRRTPVVRGELPQLGIVTSRAGTPAPSGVEVVDPGYQGIQREVLTPGEYRINPLAYEVKLADATVVPLGYCGVVTSLLGEMPGVELVTETVIGPDGEPVAGERREVQRLAEPGQRGVLQDILPPGIYYLNPYVHRVTIVEIGYNELSQLRTARVEDNIRFPSKDGFTIEVEVTVVWGRHPEHASEMIARFGDVDKLTSIMLGQIRSICRNTGSEYLSTDFIRGEKRELYQKQVTETLQRVAAERDIEILIALIQNIEVHGADVAKEEVDLKATIQRGYIAVEQDLTKQQQKLTAAVQADLETAKVKIDVARQQVRSDTSKRVAEIIAEGQRKADQIDAQRDLEVSRIERQIAEIDAEKTLLLGRAQASVAEMANQARADGKRMLVEAFGSGRAYNLYTFAESFAPETIQLFFAGEGTLWTDLGKMQDAAALELLEGAAGPRP